MITKKSYNTFALFCALASAGRLCDTYQNRMYWCQIIINIDFSMFLNVGDDFAFLFNCTPVGQTSDSMMVPT